MNTTGIFYFHVFSGHVYNDIWLRKYEVKITMSNSSDKINIQTCLNQTSLGPAYVLYNNYIKINIYL